MPRALDRLILRVNVRGFKNGNPCATAHTGGDLIDYRVDRLRTETWVGLESVDLNVAMLLVADEPRWRI